MQTFTKSFLNRFLQIVFCCLFSLVSGCSDIKKGGWAIGAHYSVTAPADRSLSKEELENLIPSDIPENYRPQGELPRGATFEIAFGEAQQPDDPQTPAVVTVNKNRIKTSTGKGPKESQAISYLKNLPYIGAGLIVLGILILAAKQWLFMFPIWLGPAISGVGLALIALPEFIEQFLVPLCWIGIITAVALGLYWIYQHNQDRHSLIQTVKGLESLKEKHSESYDHVDQQLREFHDEKTKKIIQKIKLS